MKFPGPAFMIGYELIILNFSLKVSSWMCTAWTYFRSFLALMDVSAVSALPAQRSIALKGLVVL